MLMIESLIVVEELFTELPELVVAKSLNAEALCKCGVFRRHIDGLFIKNVIEAIELFIKEGIIDVADFASEVEIALGNASFAEELGDG